MPKKYFQNIISQITAAFDGLDENRFTELLIDAEKCIKDGGKIIASGLGKNVPICEKFVGTMNSLGLESAFLHSNTAMHGDLGMIKPSDLILILSKSGSTAETVAFARYIKDWNVKTWGLSFNNGGALSGICDNMLLLPLETEGDPWNIVPNNSSSCYLILLQGIALYLSERLGVTLADFKRNHPGGAIGERLSGESS
jgi:arabinose-5-phosphate isomerase